MLMPCSTAPHPDSQGVILPVPVQGYPLTITKIKLTGVRSEKNKLCSSFHCCSQAGKLEAQQAACCKAGIGNHCNSWRLPSGNCEELMRASVSEPPCLKRECHAFAALDEFVEQLLG